MVAVDAITRPRVMDRSMVLGSYPARPKLSPDGTQCRGTLRQEGSRRDDRTREADLEPRTPVTAHGRGVSEGRRAAALDGADRRDRPVDRGPEAAARALAPGAARGVRGRPRAVRRALDGVRAPLPLRRPHRADPAAKRVVPDRARPADGPAHPRLRPHQRPLLPAAAAQPSVGAGAVSGRVASFVRSRPPTF